jgi:hypothetical protein
MNPRIDINIYDFGDLLANYVIPNTIPEWEAYGVATREFDDPPVTSTICCGSNVTTRSLLIRNVVIGVEQVLGHMVGGPVRNPGEVYVIACFSASVEAGFAGYSFVPKNPTRKTAQDIGFSLEKACWSAITVLAKTYPTEVFLFSGGDIESPDVKNQVKTQMLSYRHQNKRILTKFLKDRAISIDLKSGDNS